MKAQITNILLAGVGGQGILLASEVLSECLMQAGFDVKKSEIHGMSQRGGSVVSHVRFGKEVFSPIIPEGEGDILLGFEIMETYRYLPLLRKGGTVIANTLRLTPPSVAIGKENYPEGLEGKITESFSKSLIVDGLKIATVAGNPRTANTVLVGALSKSLEIEEKYWLAALEKMVPTKALYVNIKAFKLGRSL